MKDANEENVKAWLKDPESIKPGNKMTGTYPKLSDSETDALYEYLKGLKRKASREEREILGRSHMLNALTEKRTRGSILWDYLTTVDHKKSQFFT